MNETTDQFAALKEIKILSKNATVPTREENGTLALRSRVIFLQSYIRSILDTIGIKTASTMVDSGKKFFWGMVGTLSAKVSATAGSIFDEIRCVRVGLEDVYNSRTSFHGNRKFCRFDNSLNVHTLRIQHRYEEPIHDV